MATPIFSTPTTAPTGAVADQARGIARMLREGFDRHYALFRECARAAKRHFEAGNWLAIQHVARDRIDFYDRRVQETADSIERESELAGLDGAGGDALWEQVKLHYIGLLIDHKQPECAETFFNSVSVKTLHRAYFHNRFIFVRPTISTEHIDADPPSYRSYYPLQQGLRHALIDIVLDFGFERRFADFRRRPAPRARGVSPAPPAAVPARVQPPDPGAVVAVLPQPDRVHRRARRQRRPRLPVRRADQARRRGQALLRRAAHGRRRPRDPVLGEPRLLPGRHGSAVRLRRLPARDAAGQDGRGALHDGRPAEGAARTSSSATSCTTCGTRATSSSSRRASRAS